MGVVISNLIISTYQEIRAKKTVDKLSILSSKIGRAVVSMGSMEKMPKIVNPKMRTITP